jgi:prolyl-tRNA synthetase
VVIGRSWADGVVELRNRFTGETLELAIASADTELAALVG